jgi:hypothetical protein
MQFDLTPTQRRFKEKRESWHVALLLSAPQRLTEPSNIHGIMSSC